MSRVLSYDVGGTKTRIVYYDENGLVINEIEVGSCHILQVEDDLIKYRLRKGLELLNGYRNVSIVLGFAGYGSNLKIRQQIELICEEVFFEYEYLIFNDAELALENSLSGRDGILVISGTGSIGLARNDSKIYRCGGFGYLLGDEGSGYSIGLSALKSVCLMEDGRLQKTELYNRVLSFGNWKNAYDMIDYVHSDDVRNRIAGFSKIVGELCARGESVSCLIVNKAANDIAEIINYLLKYFDGCGDVLASGVGGIFFNFLNFSDLVKRCLDTRVKWLCVDNNINYGGYLLAKKNINN